MDDSSKDSSSSSKNLDAALEGINEANRARLRRLLLKWSFVTPIIASFGMAALNIDDVAFAANSTAPSDSRVKADLVKVDTHPAGFGLYRFRYLWSETEYVGVIAQEVRELMPEAVRCGEDGILRVDYKAIGVDIVRYAAWRGPSAAPEPAMEA
jgi:hypothetical protein